MRCPYCGFAQDRVVDYIRFASVYRDFKDVREFKAELEELLGGGKDGQKRR
jgi:transcriptional repressor NrdR